MGSADDKPAACACTRAAGLVFGLLEDLVETITISECEGVFTYLEEHAQALERPRAKQNGEYVVQLYWS